MHNHQYHSSRATLLSPECLKHGMNQGEQSGECQSAVQYGMTEAEFQSLHRRQLHRAADYRN